MLQMGDYLTGARLVGREVVNFGKRAASLHSMGDGRGFLMLLAWLLNSSHGPMLWLRAA